MAERCETVAVLGAGVMGSAIAAHMAGAGLKTFLLDIVPPNLTEAERGSRAARNRLAQGGVDKALKARPAAFFDPEAAAMVTCGNLEDDLDALGRCDLVIEAVLERLDVKQQLFAKIAPHLKAGALLASNTSGLSLAEMTRGLPEALQRQFVVMHFFNPVRYMRLLELVPGPKTTPEVMARAAALGELLGKGVVYAKDTPNFVANRIGVYAMMKAIHAMEAAGLSIEEVDKIVGKPMGRPASAAFRTADLVGIDTFVHVANNCFDGLPNDEEHEIFRVPEWMGKLVKEGRTGQKTGAGFYRKVGNDILVLDRSTGEYRPQNKVRFASLGEAKNHEHVEARLHALVRHDDPAGRFAWSMVASCAAYAARRIGEIADDILNVDRAMRWGFNWELGPFETWDAIGVAEGAERMAKEGIAVPKWVEGMLASGRKSFYDGGPGTRQYFDLSRRASVAEPRDPQHIVLAGLRQTKTNVVRSNLSASLVDLGDGALCLEVHTKMNVIDDDVIAMVQEGVDEAERNFQALIVGNDGEHFGAGANLMLVFMAAQNKAWSEIDTMAIKFQAGVQRLRYSRVPVVAATFGYTFGGACEIAMSCSARQAHAETYMGLVEVGVGLVPSGGGCLRMVERWTAPIQHIDGVDPLPVLGQASLNIVTAKVSTGAEDARRLKFLLAGDGISLNRDRLLYAAKQRALGLARANYRPPRPRLLRAAGWDAARTVGMRIWSMQESGFASGHDALISNKVAEILCGGRVAAGTEVTEQHYLDLEREAFLSLCGEEKTIARMQSILMSNKPLRN